MNRSALLLLGALLVALTLPARSAVTVFGELPQGVVDSGGVLAGHAIVSAAAGAAHLLLLSANGKVFAEGASTRGQLGNGVSGGDQGVVASKAGPELTGSPFVAVAAGMDSSYALTADGRVFGWGLNHYGQLGTGDTNDLIFYPQAVDTNGVLQGRKVTAIAAGALHCLALTSDGRVFAWGHNDFGQLGNGTTNDSRVPVAVDIGGGLAGKVVTAIAAGGSFSLALTSDGQIFGWGYNGEGALGDGTIMDHLSPVAVDLTGVPPGAPVTALSAGADFSLALTGFGRVLAWGNNDKGQMGDGTRNPRLKPAVVDFTAAKSNAWVIRLATGSRHSVVLTADSTALAWGDNQFVELALEGVNEDHLTPVLVPAVRTLADVTITGVFGGSSAYSSIFATAGPVHTTLKLTPAGAEFSLTGEPFTFYGLERIYSFDPRVPVGLGMPFLTDGAGYATQVEDELSTPAFFRAVPTQLPHMFRSLPLPTRNP